MVQINSLLDYILEVEGKTSSDSGDVGPAKCVPAGGIHTVRGITFCKWKADASKIGLNPSYSSFLNMTDKQYSDFIHYFYMNNQQYNGWWKLFQVKPVLASFMIDWGYNRGEGGLEGDLARFQRELMKIQDNDITIPEAFTNFRTSKWSENALLVALYYRRIKIYRTIDARRVKNGLPSVIKGWTNRVNKFYKRFAPIEVLNELRSQGQKI